MSRPKSQKVINHRSVFFITEPQGRLSRRLETNSPFQPLTWLNRSVGSAHPVHIKETRATESRFAARSNWTPPSGSTARHNSSTHATFNVPGFHFLGHDGPCLRVMQHCHKGVNGFRDCVKLFTFQHTKLESRYG